MSERVLMCACGCGKTLEQAKREARANPGWLNADQAEAGVEGVWSDEQAAR